MCPRLSSSTLRYEPPKPAAPMMPTRKDFRDMIGGMSGGLGKYRYICRDFDRRCQRDQGLAVVHFPASQFILYKILLGTTIISR